MSSAPSPSTHSPAPAAGPGAPESGKVEIPDGLVLLGFGATWCAPWRLLQPALTQLADQGEGRFALVLVDVDEHADLARDYVIASLPTFCVLLEGRERRRVTGAVSVPELSELLTRYGRRTRPTR